MRRRTGDSISKTVRLPTKLVEFIEGYQGDSFTDKLIAVLDDYRFGAEKKADRIQDNVVSEYIKHLRQKNPDIRNTSIRTYMRTLKVFFRFCADKGYSKYFFHGVKLPRDDSVPKMPLTAAEVARIDEHFEMSTICGTRNYCIIHLMLDCGLRCQEVIHLKMEHLQEARNIIFVKDSKGRKSRFVLAPDFLFVSIRKYMELSGHAGGYVFLGLRKPEPITQNTIRQMVDDVKRVTGVSFHPHLLRHTFATSYLLGGGNMEFLRAFMGHYDYSVTQGYTQIAAQCKMLGVDVYHLDPIYFTRGF